MLETFSALDYSLSLRAYEMVTTRRRWCVERNSRLMRVGYARVSTVDQNAELHRTGCEKMYTQTRWPAPPAALEAG